jgi:histidinol dehydrogenase
VRCELLAPECGLAALVGDLRALIPSGEAVSDGVRAILEDVRQRGDAAVLEYTRRFDTGGASPLPLRVSRAEVEDAAARMDPDIRRGLELAIENVRATALASVNEDRIVRLAASEIAVREAPLHHAAVYVPGGRAPYPSTVVMGVVTAIASGVTTVSVCAPPSAGGEIDPVVLGACGLAGAGPVFRMGGAQAIAALAYGTESIEAAEVIVGPGNLWVQEAKRQVSGHVGIDGFAGPSDLLVLADADADPEPIALDLLAQAEHGPGTLVVGASASADLLHRLSTWVQAEPETGAVCRLVKLASTDEGAALAQMFAPEHLQLIGAESEALASEITHAGCVFIGAAAATAFGDYIAGSNHILPTNGAARFASALNAQHFRRRFSEVRITDPSALASAAAPVARTEGFEFHARSMEARIRDNRSQP